MGDKALEIEVLRAFARQVRIYMTELSGPDTAKTSATAHRLKGSAASIGAFELAEAAKHRLQLADANGVDRDAHRDAMKQALGATFLTSCKESMTTAQVRCILDAANPEHAKACVSP